MFSIRVLLAAYPLKDKYSVHVELRRTIWPITSCDVRLCNILSPSAPCSAPGKAWFRLPEDARH